MRITIKQIEDKEPCSDGWDPFVASYKGELPKTTTIEHILKFNGVGDTLWVIDNCIKGQKVKKRRMVADFAESVLHIFEDWAKDNAPEHLHAPRKAIEAIRNGRMTKEIKRAANAAAGAGYATHADAVDATYAAAYAAHAAYAAANVLAARSAVDAVDAAYTASNRDIDACVSEKLEQIEIITKYFG